MNVASCLASRSQRAEAFLIDVALRQLPFVVLGVLGILSENATLVGLAIPVFFISILLWTLTDIVLLTQAGQTVGKYVVGIRIRREDGGRVGFVRIVLVRTLLARALGLLPYLGVLWWWLDHGSIITQKTRRALHDRLAGTIVVAVSVQTAMPDENPSISTVEPATQTSDPA